MTKKERVSNLLENNPHLLEFIQEFHAHLSHTNPGRRVSQDRTPHEQALDSIGRLLVGDEVCAAVALDDKWLISTNRANHVISEVSLHRTSQALKILPNGKYVDLTTSYRIIAQASDGRKKEITETRRELWKYEPLNHWLIPKNKKLIFSLQPDEHGIDEYDDVISLNITQDKIILHPQAIAAFKLKKEISASLQDEIVYRAPLDPFQRRAGTIFFHMMQVANLVKRGKWARTPSGEMINRYDSMCRHRTKVMLQTFFWSAATWYPLFKGTKKRKGFNLDACQPTHRNVDIFLALLPDEQLDKLNDNEALREEASLLIRRYVRRLVQEVTSRINGYEEEARIAEFNAWCIETQDQAETRREDYPSYIFDTNGAHFFFERFKKYFMACERLKELQSYIEALSSQCNAFLQANSEKPAIIAIKEWAGTLCEELLKPEENRTAECPTFLRTKSKCSLQEFFERFSKYYIDTLKIETYVMHKAKSSTPDDRRFTEQLLDLKSYENTQSSGLFIPKIIDGLADGAHAEIRLFYYLTQILHRDVQSIPYFGITQLCCANCRTFLSGHGLTHEEGQRHHAGMHGKHYPDWVLDDIMCTKKNLQALLGPAYHQYDILHGDYTIDDETKTLKEWARMIIQELGVLDNEMMEKFNIPGQPLFPKGSNYADEDFEMYSPIAVKAATKIQNFFRSYVARQNELAVEAEPRHSIP